MNNILDLFDNFRINVDDNLCFSFVVSLIEFDYPRCFIARGNDDFFAFMECECDDEHVSWTVSKIDKKQIKSVHSGEKNVQSLFDDELFEVKYNFSNGIGIKKEANPIHEIKGNFLSPNFGDLDELFDIHGLQEASIQSRENSVSIVFDKENEGSTSLILRAINYLKSLMKNLRHPFDILKTNLSVQRGSTVITFTSKDDLNKEINLTPDLKPLSNDSFLEMKSILASNDSLELLSNAKSSKKILKNYKGIINTLKKEDDIKPKIVVAMSEYKNPTSFDMGKNSATTNKKILDEAIKLVDSKTDISEKKIKLQGIFAGIYLTKKGSFHFKELGGLEREFKGSVDVSLQDTNEGCLVKSAIYDVEIKEITSIVDGVEQKKTFVLCNFNFVKKIEQHENVKLFE